jgi:hypothetical protein
MTIGMFAGIMRYVEKEFKLGPHKYEEYKGLRFRDGDYTLVSDVWIHRVDEDDSGLTFEEWDREVIPLPLESTARGDRRTRGSSLKQIHGIDTRRYVLSVDGIYMSHIHFEVYYETIKREFIRRLIGLL